MGVSNEGGKKKKKKQKKKKRTGDEEGDEEGRNLVVALDGRSTEDHTNFNDKILNAVEEWPNQVIYERRTQTYFIIEDVNLDEDKGVYPVPTT